MVNVSDYADISCGVAQITAIGSLTGKEFVKDIKEVLKPPKEDRSENSPYYYDYGLEDDGINNRVLLFSDVVATPRGKKGWNRVTGNKGGQAIANYIKRKKYGSITETRSVINFNSGNKIKVWAWIPPYDWYQRSLRK